jgi:pilus assembly protein CpaB
MKKWKIMLPIVFALLIASTASVFLYKWMQAHTAPKEVVKVESEAVPVAVATAALSWGTKLQSEMMRSTPYLKESLPEGYCSSLDTLKGRVLIAPVKRNEPILESKLAPTTVASGGVSAIVTPGKRALAVKGDKVIGISGFILPGNRIDVIVTLRNEKNKKDMTKIVLERILVLATGTQIEENDKGEPAPVDVYTLEVTPEEGEKLALAATRGKLRFALRNVTDDEIVLTKGATVQGTLSSYRPPVSRKVLRQRSTVEVIRGSEVKKVKFYH